MKLLYPTLAVSVLSVGMSLAQEEKEEKEIDLEARKASIPIIEGHIEDRQERMAEIANDIMALDRRLEAKLQKVVNRLASIKDSTKSGYRVSQIKMDAMEGLRKTAENYQSKRAALITEIREGRTGIPKEVLESDAKIFDQHIEKRVEQILQLSKSFTQDASVKKYEQVEGSSYYDGWGWGDASRISDEYRQNRRDRTMNKKQRNEMITALKKSIERHESLIAGFKDSLENRRMSEADRELMRSEMNRHIRILDTRQGQLEELIIVPQPATAPLTRDAAMDLQDALKDAASDMRRDFETIFVKYADLNRERSKVFKLKRNLEARKKWIAEYEAKAKE
ncbi:MAG: hypothetical protein GWO24_18655, partial [Akkermansiaceae bacterium]|nr:hypothetical protein [Akkermansiaceae bacterium]